MSAIVVVSKVTSGTEAPRLLNELTRWAEDAGNITVDRRDADTLALMVAAEPLSYGAARRMFEDVLTAANPPWSIHVRIEQSSRLLKGETRLTSLC